ncbi:MAG: sialate O-acetylesterase [Phycisphaeraceae bacterium]
MIRFLICCSSFFVLLALLFASDASASGKQGDINALDQAKVETAVYDGPKENLHVYLLIGQSNMAGRAKVPEEMSGVIERCYLLNDKNQWVPAKNPMNLYSAIRKGEGMQKLGPGYGFALAMLEANPDINIGLVVNARGGSKIEAWESKAKYYLTSRDRTKAAMKTGTLKGVLWHQGESNASKHATYLEQLKTLVGNLRSDLGDKDLPFIAGQVRPTDGMKPINAEIAKLPSVLLNTGCAKSEGLTTFDGTHFDAKSQVELGQRYAQQMLELQATSNKKKKH